MSARIIFSMTVIACLSLGCGSSGTGTKRENVEEVTAKRIEVFGDKLNGERRAMSCTLVRVTNTWVDILLKDSSYVGVYVKDMEGGHFQYGFAKKDKFGEELLKMKSGDRMRIIGTIQKVGFEYGIIIDAIER
jgi:hypothetical protein